MVISKYCKVVASDDITIIVKEPTMYFLYYCNPHDLVGVYRTLDEALAHRDPDYCQYVVLVEHTGRSVVWSTANSDPTMMIGYAWAAPRGWGSVSS
jgi:hypothetical protein